MDGSDNIIPPLDQPYPYQRGTMTADGRWMPAIPPKSVSVFNDRTRIILLTGARKSSKTLSGICNKVARHLWEVEYAGVGIIGKTIRNAGLGVWNDLISFCLPGWIDSGIGMQITQPEKMTSDSHMRYLRTNNQWGSTGEVQLHSLDHDRDVEKKFKSMRFSMIVISEIDQFGDRSVLDILLDQLRITGVPYEDHQLIADCNPPLEGEDHWLYNAIVNQDESNKERLPNSTCYHFTLADNPFLPEPERQELMNKYSYDPVKYERFVNGKWVKDTAEGYFDDTFSFNIHVVGSIKSAKPEEWELITPPPNTAVLITGTDVGDLNHATTFMVARASASRDVVFDIFDELVSLSNPVSLRVFGEMLLEKVKYWEGWCQDEYKTKRIYWRHWVDSSAMNYKAGADQSDAMTIYQATGKYVRMMSAKKGPGSIKQRINLARRLFHGNRLFMSALCQANIEWARHLRPGKSRGEVIARGLRCRHAFDAATYAIAQEIPLELEMREAPEVRKGAIVQV